MRCLLPSHPHGTMKTRARSDTHLPWLGRFPSCILGPLLLIRRMDPLLDRLDSPNNEAPHDSNAIHFVFLLAVLKPVQKDLHLLYFLTRGCGAPGLLHHRSVPDIRRQGRIWIGSVEPSVVPTLQRSFEGEA